MAGERKPQRRLRPDPPVETRWKPGQSGNPKGRPKGPADFLAGGHAILSEPVKACTADGGTKTLAAVEAAYIALCRKGLKGHVPSLLQAIRTAIEVLPAAEADVVASKARLREKREELARKLGRTVPAALLGDG